MPTVAIALNKDDYERLQSCLNECRQTQDFLETCLECGIDVAVELADTREQIHIADKMLQLFFPKGKPKK